MSLQSARRPSRTTPFKPIDPKGDSDEKILLAAKICPTKAIALEEEGTGKKIFPAD